MWVQVYAVRIYMRWGISIQKCTHTLLGLSIGRWRKALAVGIGKVGHGCGLTIVPSESVSARAFMANIMVSSKAVTARDFSRHSTILPSRYVMKSIAWPRISLIVACTCGDGRW